MTCLNSSLFIYKRPFSQNRFEIVIGTGVLIVVGLHCQIMDL